MNKEMLVDNPFNVDNPYKIVRIKECFPEASDERLLALYNLNLEAMDRYGVSMSVGRIYLTAKVIDELAREFPEFSNSEGLKPEYIHSAYSLMVVLHNLHKVSTKLIYTAGLNQLYAVILNSNVEEDKLGYTILKVKDEEVKNMARNALLISRSMNIIAQEKDYLELIMNLLPNYPLSKQWLIFSHANYNQILEYMDIPTYLLQEVFLKD